MRNPLRTWFGRVVRGRTDGRVRAVWRVLVPVLAGFITLQLAGATAFALGLNTGQMMVASFVATTLVMLLALGLSARYLDRRPVRAYGFNLSRDWWLDLVGGTVIGSLVVALTFVVGQQTGGLRVTGSLSLGGTSPGWLLAFLVAFVGVALYEEFIYRGAFVTNTIEGLSERGVNPRVAAAGALLASTLAFAAIHLPGALAAGANPGLVVAKTGLLGGLLGVAYLRTGELALPMGLHLGVNYSLLNVFGIGTEGLAGVPSLLAVEVTATGLWSPARGLPLFGSIATGYVLLFGWLRWRQADGPARSSETSTPTTSD
ncbi:CPBP family intramembrane glutamic endopeptidase [Haloglomus litoreum]|uniref:CPBP family intramembrane glutamic endopeptidase n=1 Tax=Haloglomus litoreum TaxID=3034026 RepID=UPI0023E77AF3|nr:type II CAAX endopeptidase family protein [Haloglomus sp. DT116]